MQRGIFISHSSSRQPERDVRNAFKGQYLRWKQAAAEQTAQLKHP